MSDLLARAREALNSTLAYLDGGQETGFCMCGSRIEHHGMGDGHSPVDEGLYYANKLREEVKAALSTLPDAVAGERERCARIADEAATGARALRDMARKDKDGLGAFIHAAEMAEAQFIAAAIRKEPA
jgi:hypothetical protein